MSKDFTKRDYIALLGMIVGMFMAILDIQIVVTSLSAIASGISATQDEMSWVQTSYMIAEVIMIPATGFLARCFSTRTLFFSANLLFTLASILCAFAWNIESMICFRAIQGLFGGVMIPSVFSIIFSVFTGNERMRMGIVIGLVVTLAPTIGPVLGGYITEIISWRFMFFINVVPGILVFITTYFHRGFDKPNLSLLKNFDFIGLVLMAMGLGSLQYMLEEGAKLNWFDDLRIVALFCVSSFSLAMFVLRELSYDNPIVYLKAFRDRNFMVGCIAAFVLGVGLFGVVYLVPLFLYAVGGLNSIQIGQIMMVTGAAQFVAGPFAPIVKKFFTFKQMLYGGMASFAFGCYLNSSLTSESQFYEFLIPQLIRGVSLTFCFIPIAEIVFSTLPKNEIKDASGLYNLVRNLGGAIGLAVINTMIIRDTKIFSSYLSENIFLGDPKTWYFMDKLKSIFSGKVLDSNIFTYKMLDKLIYRDALIITINNLFIYIATLFICSLIIVYFAKERSENEK